jgi:hypothetical protein
LHKTKEEFILGMEKLSYCVKWEPHYKYITYTTPQGQKCRDNRLHEEKYLKQNMEEYYHVGLSKTEGFEQTDRQLAKAVRTASDGHTERTVGRYGAVPDRDRQIPAASQRTDREAANLGEHHGGIKPGHWDRDYTDKGNLGQDNHPSCHRTANTDEGVEEGDLFANDGDSAGNRKKASNERSIAAEAQVQVDGHRSLRLHDALYLAKTIEDIINPYEPKEKKKKYVTRLDRKKRKKKTRQQSHDDYDLSL